MKKFIAAAIIAISPVTAMAGQTAYDQCQSEAQKVMVMTDMRDIGFSYKDAMQWARSDRGSVLMTNMAQVVYMYPGLGPREMAGLTMTACLKFSAQRSEATWK